MLARHKDLATTMKYYVKARDKKARLAVESLRVGRSGGRGA